MLRFILVQALLQDRSILRQHWSHATSQLYWRGFVHPDEPFYRRSIQLWFHQRSIRNFPCDMDVRYFNKLFTSNWLSLLKKNNMTQSSNEKSTFPSLILETIWKSFGKLLIIAILYELVADICRIFQPKLLQYFLQSFSTSSTSPFINSFFIALLMHLISIVGSVFNNLFYLMIFEAGLSIRSNIMSMIYQKSLRLLQSSKQNKTAGDIINMVSSDVLNIQRFFENSQQIVGITMFFYHCCL